MTRMNNTRNGYIRVTTKVVQFGDKFREVRLTWFGHMGQRSLNMEVPGRRRRRRRR